MKNRRRLLLYLRLATFDEPDRPGPADTVLVTPSAEASRALVLRLRRDLVARVAHKSGVIKTGGVSSAFEYAANMELQAISANANSVIVSVAFPHNVLENERVAESIFGNRLQRCLATRPANIDLKLWRPADRHLFAELNLYGDGLPGAVGRPAAGPGCEDHRQEIRRDRVHNLARQVALSAVEEISFHARTLALYRAVSTETGPVIGEVNS